MRIWVDCTAAAHPLVLRPIIERLRAAGHEVEITTREYGQTIELLDLHGLEHTPIGRHGGASRARKAAHASQRTAAMIRFGRRRGFDLALAHGSVDLAIVGARSASRRRRCTTTSTRCPAPLSCRLATPGDLPGAVPAERLRRSGSGPASCSAIPG